jgi:hypothetical protein
MELANSFILIPGCDSFFIMMSKPRQRTVFSIPEKMDILAQADTSKGWHTAVTARLGIVLSALNTIVKYWKNVNKCYTQCGRYSGQRKSLKQSPLQELESLLATWFKQATSSNQWQSADKKTEKTPHIATRLGIEDYKISDSWIECFKQ